ncbi:DoxX family protein [Methylococcus sp. EFPC2]|uniref:DoxX family protein n=1 Tax=Methylococcus sp. EFPC2 TaxID=2812648 RepID=UPI00196735F9|nr:DoxX family protein [Methylococcus sp. EFPC2]QSA95775.1 DoxX family protein [Methylococcus sp. EFPC2]
MNTYADAPYRTDARKPRHWLGKLAQSLDFFAPVGDLLLRAWVAYAFWVSGLTKIQSWDSTLYLFQEEYAVPLLPPELAAWLGTAVELGFPVLLAFGLLGRFAAGVLFLFNIVAVISYPDLGAAGLEQHKVWGIMLLVCLLHGPGKLSLNYWIARRFLARRS